MKTTLRLASAAFLAVLSTAAARAQDEPVKPTAEHVELAKEVGTWDAEVKIWLRGPEAPPDVSKGVEEISLMPGGLWLLSKFDGKMNGAPFSGHGISGYDPSKKKFIDVWVDSSDPHMMVLEGTYDEKTKTLTSLGKSTDPRTKAPYDVKTETVLKGEDEREFTFFIKSDETQGQYYKLLQMTYKRKAK
ncbi:DUF1579 domain-containing protein [Paludisphaera mucosa]|uniref:DUF1579 domain-containing protein n=1 Tax=Paludisphaera mucosa TaxID=3030827 RepID=A0ABT6F5E0_9BACT|nr:DUF1579 domain-containing protein [Paludisphaera mucosa]MDG3002793.1 DUF1579 domain-containing protein [Paludisphaera mucosa]